MTSHELRQPVSAILNCSSLVRSNLASLRQSLGKCYTERQPFTPYPALMSIIDDDLDALDAIYQVCYSDIFKPLRDTYPLEVRASSRSLSMLPTYFQRIDKTEIERIANDVLSLSRIQLQVLSIHPVEFNLTAEVERIVSIFRNEVKM